MNYNDFVDLYPEFKGLSEDVYNAMQSKILCLFPQYKNTQTNCANKILGYLLIAHFLVIEGKAVSLGINKPSGVVASSNVGSVSVSMQTPPYKNATDYFFYSTPYGLEYLAYLDQIGGMCYVN